VRVTDDGAATLDTNPDAFPEWANFDSVRISRKELMNGTIRTKDDKEGQPAFLYSIAPEQWELNIISLENGEWNSGMKKDAFGKYKKERPALTGLFGVNDTQLNSSSHISRKKEFDSLEKSSPSKAKKKKTTTRRNTGIKKSKSADRKGIIITPKKTKT